MQATGHEWNRRRHEAFIRMSEKSKQRTAEWKGAFTQNIEPPGDGWDTVIHSEQAFAAAGLCELWRMDLEDRTAFFRFSDFPPGFNLGGLWWRPAS